MYRFRFLSAGVLTAALLAPSAALAAGWCCFFDGTQCVDRFENGQLVDGDSCQTYGGLIFSLDQEGCDRACGAPSYIPPIGGGSTSASASSSQSASSASNGSSVSTDSSASASWSSDKSGVLPWMSTSSAYSLPPYYASSARSLPPYYASSARSLPPYYASSAYSLPPYYASSAHSLHSASSSKSMNAGGVDGTFGTMGTYGFMPIPAPGSFGYVPNPYTPPPSTSSSMTSVSSGGAPKPPLPPGLIPTPPGFLPPGLGPIPDHAIVQCCKVGDPAHPSWYNTTHFECTRTQPAGVIGRVLKEGQPQPVPPYPCSINAKTECESCNNAVCSSGILSTCSAQKCGAIAPGKCAFVDGWLWNNDCIPAPSACAGMACPYCSRINDQDACVAPCAWDGGLWWWPFDDACGAGPMC